MRAFKFLDAEGRAPFTGTPWEPGHWVEGATATACREGVHGCRADDLSHWLAHSLWEVELAGEVVDARHKVVGERGRLVRSIDDYPTAVRELHVDGVWRCRDRAVQALEAAGMTPLAERVARVQTVEELAALGAEVDDATHASTALALAADAAHFAIHGDHSQSAFVAACSAGHLAAGPEGDQARYDAGYAEERAYQSAWLARRLQLR